MESRGEEHDAGARWGTPPPGQGRMGEPEGPSGERESDGAYRAFRERAADALEQGKSRVAGGMESLGERLEERGESLAAEAGLKRKLGRAMGRTGDAMESGGAYLRTHPVEVIGDDVVEAIREHPLASVGLALGAGFLVGRLLGAAGGSEAEAEDEWEDWDEDEEEEDDEAPRPIRRRRRARRRATLAGGLRRELGKAVISSVAALATRQLRERIAGVEPSEAEVEENLEPAD